MEQKIIDLYVKTFGETPVKVEHLFGGGGSSRCYYKSDRFKICFHNLIISFRRHRKREPKFPLKLN